MAESGTMDEQRERLHALSVLVVEIAELRDLQQVLDIALRHCLELTGSQFGFIGLIDAGGTALDVVAIQGFEASARFYERFHLIPLRPSIFARAVLDNCPVRTDDATSDPRRIGQPTGHPPVRSFLGVPLRQHGIPVGMIGVANRAASYDEEHEQLLLTYAAQVAIAIRNAQLYQELTSAKAELERNVAERSSELAAAKEALARKADDLRLLLSQTVSAQERERARIAHDMHDGLNQLIIGAMLELKAARQHLNGSDLNAGDASLQRVRALLGQVDGEIKRIIHDLRPPSLDALGLPAAITRYAERYHGFTGLPCHVEVSGRPYRLIPEAEIGIFRVAQEALQNAAAHADASRTWLSLRFEPAELQLEVGDDGVGFDTRRVLTAADGHLGIVGMYERAMGMGGTVEIVSAPGEGTRVRLAVPATGIAAQLSAPLRDASHATG